MMTVQHQDTNSSINDGDASLGDGDETTAANNNNNNNNNNTNTTIQETANGFIDDNGDEGDADAEETLRIGSISSARFNILSTMVGGGCLSLPMAFQQAGNALIGPLLLVLTGGMTEFCFRALVTNSVRLQPPDPARPGRETFESIASAAFGSSGYRWSMLLVVLMCFFGTVGYSVLLRDMLEPLNDVLAPPRILHTVPWLYHNFTMLLVILLVTPFCTLRRLTALKDCGALSMLSLLILGSCIVFRSMQCNWNSAVVVGAGGGGGTDNSDNNNNNNSIDDETGDEPWYTYLRLFPDSWHDLLNALPLFISCFVCHYNILPVHNELQNPSPARVSWWLRSTTWFAVLLYMIMGFAGSSYAHCTPSGRVQGNILLDFDKNDPLLMVGRMCLAVTITLAFPMLVIPARDIILRSLILPKLQSTPTSTSPHSTTDNSSSTNVEEAVTFTNSPIMERSVDAELQEPLLAPDELEAASNPSIQLIGTSVDDDADTDPDTDANEALLNRNADTRTLNSSHHPAGTEASTSCDNNLDSAPTILLLLTSVVIFWSAGIVASVVKSIDIVWDLLGSSLSILLSYLIPAGTYLVINNNPHDNEQPNWRSRASCWLLLCIFIPLMIVSTGNAISNTFFKM